MDDLLTEFLTETLEGLALINNQLVKLKQNIDPEFIQHIFRLIDFISGCIVTSINVRLCLNLPSKEISQSKNIVVKCGNDIYNLFLINASYVRCFFNKDYEQLRQIQSASQTGCKKEIFRLGTII